jgi:phosphatidylinositol alpha-1,6-mannosyltransferase
VLAAHVVRLAVRYRVRAVCIADDETVGWLTLAGRLLGLKTLIYCHGDDLKCASEMVPRRRRWFRRADVIVAASRYAGSLLHAEFGLPPGKIAIVRNGVDLKAFFPQSAGPSFLQQYGLKDQRVILTVTRLVARKGVDKVLEALPAIAGEFPDLVYVVVGDGPQRAALEQQAQALGLSRMVRFAGAIPHAQTKDFYNAAEIFLLPNREEAGEADGLALVFLEANACAKPVIGGMAGGTPEIVSDGENGILVDGNDAGAIAAALRDLLRNPEKRAAMAQKALQMAQDWDWTARTRAFLKLCRS